MSVPTQVPTKTGEDNFGETWEHPAFGNVTVSQWHSNKGVRLCGSDLGHHTGITVEVRTATLRRGLSYDRIQQDKHLLSFTFSLSQWARFVASSGNGDGLPCTIEYKTEGPFKRMPMIGAPELSKKELHGREMAQDVAERLEAMRQHVKGLEDMLAAGRLGKRELGEHFKELRRHLEQIPGSIQFVYDQFTRATEKVTEDAKTEVEGFVDGVAKRLGYQQIKEMAPALTLPEKVDQEPPTTT